MCIIFSYSIFIRIIGICRYYRDGGPGFDRDPGKLALIFLLIKVTGHFFETLSEGSAWLKRGKGESSSLE